MKKKICFIVSTPRTAKSFLENHFEVLSKYYDVHLVARLNNSKIANYSNSHLKEIKHIPIFRKINLFNDFIALYLLTKYLKNNKFDVVTTFTPKATLIGIISGKLAGIKFRISFFTGQVWHTKKRLLKPFLIFLDKIVVKHSTNIIVDGKPQQEFLISNNVLNKNNSIVFGKGTISGIDLKRFCPKLEIRNELRFLMNFKDDDVVFMFLGRLNIDKGILDLAIAFEMLQEKYNNVKLLLVGPDEDKLIDHLKINFNLNNYYIYGTTDKPENLYQACDVFCLPSHREAFGLSIIEASACEKPIVCSDTYGLKDTIIDGETGIRHITRNPVSIFQKMEILTDDSELRRKLGVNGRRYIKKYFSKETLTNHWLKYFNMLLS